MASVPLLSFSTKKADRGPVPTIEIDGKAYRLRTRDQMSFAQRMTQNKAEARMRVLSPKIDDLTCTAEEDAEYGRLVATLASLAVDAPADVTASLGGDEQMVIVAAAFFGFRPESTAATAGTKTPRTKTKKTGARSSRA